MSVFALEMRSLVWCRNAHRFARRTSTHLKSAAGAFGTANMGDTVMDSQSATSIIAPSPRCRAWASGWALVAAAALLGQLMPQPANGSPLDPSFGGGTGIVTTDLSGADDQPRALAIQPDGKIIVVGGCATDATVCVARYLDGGGLDTAGFNASAPLALRGKRVLPSLTASGFAQAVAVLKNGKILLASGSSAIQLMPDGSDDVSFGTGGVLALSGTGSASFMKLRPDGRVVLARDCDSAMCVMQLLPDSTPDISFGPGGLRVLSSHLQSPFPGTTGYESTRALVVLNDGNLLALGTCTTTTFTPTFPPTLTTTSTGCAQRLLPDGSSDSTYATSSNFWRTFALSRISGASGPMPEGQIVLGGGCPNVATISLCLIRILSSGDADATFGTSGMFTYISSTLAGATNVNLAGIAVLPDGKIFVSAGCFFTQALFCVLRHNSDGSLDTTFDLDGRDGHNVGSGSASPTAAALQADGKFVAIGACVGSSGTRDFCVVRYLPGPSFARNCTMDIDGDGKVLASTDMLMATRVALGLTGTAVIGGVNFSANAARKTWPLIRDYLNNHCAMNLP